MLSISASSGLAVLYSSVSDQVSITDNKITLLKAGTVKIIADQPGDKNYMATESREITFCINPAKPSITATGMNTETPVLTSSNSAGSSLWFLNGNVLTGDTNNNGAITVTESGVYTVITSEGTCSSVASAEFILSITGLDDVFSEITLYPNPSHNELLIDLEDLSKKNDVEVDFFDLSGKRVLSARGRGKMNITISSLAAGDYIVRIKSDKGIVTKQIIKN
ncbi:MAG TPA: T9SS type A sorting domain-containing protein, partial [Cyclobacteriaceae bacterium]